MKSTFDFPRFEDLQLGPFGKVDGCGCLEAKILEVSIAVATSNHEEDEVWDALYSELSRLKFFKRLTGLRCPNTLANRRKAYQALERATERVLNVTIGP